MYISNAEKHMLTATQINVDKGLYVVPEKSLPNSDTMNKLQVIAKMDRHKGHHCLTTFF